MSYINLSDNLSDSNSYSDNDNDNDNASDSKCNNYALSKYINLFSKFCQPRVYQTSVVILLLIWVEDTR